MKFLIAGLGNIGAEYEETRHNVGFDVVDRMAGELGAAFENERYGWVARANHKGKTFILLKPTTYMNLSGSAVRYWMQKEKIEAPQILVVCDDLNLTFGMTRMKANGSAGGHNGLKHIEETLGNGNYPRMRVGIGNEYAKGRQVDFVLGKWADEEKELLPTLLQHCAEAAKNFGLSGIEWTMNRYNKNALEKKEEKKKSEEEKK
jgi:PTH1 family peptidyl-tRNA hydrolase